MDDKKRIMVCHDPRTGRVIWKEKLGLGNVVRASPTGADGKVYLINRSGDAVVLQAGDTFKVLSRVRMGEQPVHSTIAVANKSLYIRTAKNLYCIRK
jgi:outer membrane protein assembly factor BamB